ncbi:MAG: DUF1428 domain-containing protein [Hyphomicrobium sp.]
MSYVDGFVLAVPQNKLADYKKLARKAGKIWMEFGALEYVECVADDVPVGKITSFTRAVKLEKGEVVVFSYIVYKSRAQRDAIMKKVMADERLKADMNKIPFDAKRMIFGGFKTMIAF